ncbi:hypothetical protein FHW17_003801 [Phyllobacterium sp. P30BS-XVII]|nr:hypothetical protein [Phyllobacterium sp. P30BS-XVII]
MADSHRCKISDKSGFGSGCASIMRGSWFVVRGSWFVVRGSWFDKLTMREMRDATIIVSVAEMGSHPTFVILGSSPRMTEEPGDDGRIRAEDNREVDAPQFAGG